VIEREMLSRPLVRASMAAFAISALLAGWTLSRAVRIDAPPQAVPSQFDAFGVIVAPPVRASVDMAAAVENDLFDPDRTAPEKPFRLPGEDDPSVSAEIVASPPPVVLGTAIMGEGHSFATCQLPDGVPMIVRVGDRLGDFTVRSIEKGHVGFTTMTGKRLDIPALKTGT
jgi:hypothetical protein